MGLSAPAGIAIEWTLATITIFFVVLRFYIRCWLQSTLNLADGFILLSFLLFIYLTISNTINFHLGIWGAGVNFSVHGVPEALAAVPNRATLVTVFKLFYIAGPTYYSGLWCIKFAFIHLYYQMITINMRTMRWVLHGILAFTIIGWLVAMYLNLFFCLPIYNNWTLDEAKVCWTFPAAIPYYTTLGFHLSSDILIYAFPFRLLSLVKLPRKKLLGVMGIFALGSVCILCTVGRAITNGLGLFDMPPVGVWSGTEQATGVIVACCPPLKWLYQRHQDRTNFVRSEYFEDAPSVNEMVSIRKKVEINMSVSNV